MRQFFLCAMTALCLCLTAQAQTVGKGEQYVWNELQTGDSLLLANATIVANESLPDVDLDNCFLSCASSRCGNYWSGLYTLGVLQSLSEDNIFILVDAPDQYANGRTFKSYYLKNSVTQKYVRCDHDDVSNHGTSSLVASTDDATSFCIQNAKAEGSTFDYVNENTICLAHYEDNKAWRFGAFWNYSFTYYAGGHIVGWNAFKINWIYPRTSQTVQLTTTKAVGEEMTISVYDMNRVKVDWGNGELVEYPVGKITGTVKGANIKVVGSIHMTSIDCSDCGLTELNIEDAPNLITLHCAENSLTTLDLSVNTKLEELDCSGNNLNTLNLEQNEVLAYLDCSDNELSALDTAKMYQLRHLFCGNNNIGSLSLRRCREILTLWCQNNQLTTLDLSININLQSVFISGNKLTKVSADGLTELTDFWCDENQLAELSLPNSTPNTLSCTQNGMEKLIITKPADAYRPYLIDQSNNKFRLDSFYTSKYITHYIINPQATIELDFDQVPVGEAIDFGDYMKNAANNICNITFYTPDGQELVKGAEGQGDFNVRRAEVTFWKSFPSVYFKVSALQYPDLELFSTPFKVGEGSGIDSISDTQSQMHSGTYTIEGIKMNSKDLKPGLYIVNGKKHIVK